VVALVGSRLAHVVGEVGRSVEIGPTRAAVGGLVEPEEPARTGAERDIEGIWVGWSDSDVAAADAAPRRQPAADPRPGRVGSARVGRLVHSAEGVAHK